MQPDWDMVKVSKNLGATVVLLVALVVASLLILSFLKVFQETNIYIRRVAKIFLHFTKLNTVKSFV